VKKTRKSSGQALVEYILLLAIVLFVTINFIKGLYLIMDETFGSFRRILSDELSVGICRTGQKNCINPDRYDN